MTPETRRPLVLGHRKILRDLWAHKGRSLLVVLAITAGLVGSGSVLTQYTLVRRAVDVGYAASNPPSVTFTATPLTPELVRRVRALPGIAEAELRGTAFGRVYIGGRPHSLSLSVADDLAASRIGRVERERGTWPPPPGTLAIERSSLPLAALEVGDRVAIKISGRKPRKVEVSAIVRDVGVAPGWMEHVVYAYGSPEILGPDATLETLRVVAAGGPLPENELRELAGRVESVLEAEGVAVRNVQVHLDHIHARQMGSFLLVKAAMGLLALALSGLLAFSFVSAVLADQVREIGVMKAVGGGPMQIAGIYLGMMALLGSLASALALPIAAALGRRTAELSALALNFDLDGVGIPIRVFAALLAAGLAIPVVSAVVPVWRGARMSVAEALRDDGTLDLSSAGATGRLFQRVAGRSRPLLLSLRNAVRRPGRAALTLVALAAGGAIFVGALNLREAIGRTVDGLFERIDYDVAVALRRPEPREKLEGVISKLPGVVAVETGSRARAARIGDDGTRSDAFPLVAPPSASRLVEYPVLEGRGLREGDRGVLVVNPVWARRFPDVAVGDTVSLVVDGRHRSWRVVGVVRSASTGSVAYAHFDDLTAWLGEAGLARTALVRVDPTDEALIAHIRMLNESLGGRPAAGGVPEEVARAHGLAPAPSGDGPGMTREQVLADLPALMESILEGYGGFEVAGSQSVQTAHAGLADHMVMVVDFLLYMSLLVLAVGGCGLATTMSLAVLERTREIGVLRALGASHRSIVSVVLAESLVFGAASWALALVAAAPIGRVLGGVFGGMMFGSDVGFAVTPGVAGLWLLVVLAISALSSAWPALRAVRVTTARALAST